MYENKNECYSCRAPKPYNVQYVESNRTFQQQQQTLVRSLFMWPWRSASKEADSPSLPPLSLSLSLSLSLCLSELVCACMWCACVFVCIAARRRLEMPKLRSELLRVENRMFQVWYEGASGYGWQEAGAAFVYTDGAHPIGNGCLSWSQPGGPCSPAGALSLVQDPRTATPAKPSVGLY